ncbi:MAG TPA: hypothetical protein VII61_04480 [Ktedonobacteraceae bacterium]
MRELNEQELELVAGGSGWTFSYLSQEQAAGTVLAGNGIAYSKSFVGSSHSTDSSSSFAANKSFAFGTTAGVQSVAASASSVTITGN